MNCLVTSKNPYHSLEHGTRWSFPQHTAGSNKIYLLEVLLFQRRSSDSEAIPPSSGWCRLFIQNIYVMAKTKAFIHCWGMGAPFNLKNGGV
jgi:hypothetical protein